MEAARNPYENAELFVLLERLRRADDMDEKTEYELGLLLMSVTKFAYTLYRKAGHVVKDAPPEAESEMLLYVIDVSRRADLTDPQKYVNCLVKSAQNKLRAILRDTIRRKQVISPYMVEESGCCCMRCGIDGTPDSDIYEQIKLYSKKDSENDEKDI